MSNFDPPLDAEAQPLTLGREVYREWARPADAPELPSPPPRGARTPNGLVWGHAVSDFFAVKGVPQGVGTEEEETEEEETELTVWSRSMIRELGGACGEFCEDGELEPEPEPCLRSPWPVLELSKEKQKVESTGDALQTTACAAPASDQVQVTQAASARTDDTLPTVRGRHEPDINVDSSPNERPPADGEASPAFIPKLEEFIPNKYLPDTLVVHDPDHVACHDLHSAVKTYKRVYPLVVQQDSDEDPASTSVSDTKVCAHDQVTCHLHLQKSAKIGSGHHSLVFRAQLSLPAALSAHSPNNQVTVAAKVAIGSGSEKDLLDNEATTYNAFPRHLQEEWSGFNMIEGLKDPVPVGAVVPKFYGYYVPDEAKDTEPDSVNVEKESTFNSPILLLEECGRDVNPYQLTSEAKLECLSLFYRLHHAQFLQMSSYIRNMLVQPGPLTLPHEKRSMETPSFRIIDFGRAKARLSESEEELDSEIRHARRELNPCTCGMCQISGRT